ncbi:hypothetical protein ACFZAV_38695 [Streptomyces sp. NPDC008343]|uniref:hypothetical protein n=1 Tax=Streptomyces sp. NPDC008343 TaxID=3364828 RepID=UPI0036EF95DE
MNTIGSSTDNTLAVSFNATFKRETLQARKSWSSERGLRLDASAGCTATTPDAVTPASGTAARSPPLSPVLPWQPGFAGHAFARSDIQRDAGNAPGAGVHDLMIYGGTYATLLQWPPRSTIRLRPRT